MTQPTEPTTTTPGAAVEGVQPSEPAGGGPAGEVTPEPGGGEPDTFPRAYVQQLREEAATSRVRAQQADALSTELLRVTVASVTAPVLRDPADLPEGDYLNPSTGLPDHDLIRQAAEAVAAERPHLARVRGDVGQGARPEADEGFSLAGTLRAAAV